MLQPALYITRSHDRVQMQSIQEKPTNTSAIEMYNINTFSYSDSLNNGTLEYGDQPNDTKNCRIVLIQSNATEISMNADQLIFAHLDTTTIQQLKMLCLNSNTTIIAPAQNNISSAALSSSVEAFSVTLLETQQLNVVKHRPERIDGWTSKMKPYFDRSFSYLVGLGSYTVPYDGVYLVNIQLLLENECMERFVLCVLVKRCSQFSDGEYQP